MRICLLGEFCGDLDEGARKTSFYFAKELSKYHEVVSLDLRSVFTKEFWISIKKFNSHVVHYIHGCSFKSLALLKLISLYCSDAKSVMSVMRPYLSPLLRGIISLLKPDLVLIQSYETEKTIKELELRTEFLPCGVDVKKFKPVSPKSKRELRKKYGIDEKKFVILHIGPIKKERNVQLLEKLQNGDNQVLVVGSISTGVESKAYQQLKKKGCLVWIRYFENIEEIYTLSDCYVFPTIHKSDMIGRTISSSIETPLSVLEAMSCNLPVISMKFGVIPRIFNDGNGLFFCGGESKFIATVENIKTTKVDIKTRDKVLPYSWENVVKRLEEIYEEILNK